MDNSGKTPLFAITMGDPAGIGPEIALKALISQSLTDDCRIFIIGDFAVLEHAMRLALPRSDLHAMQSVDDFQTGSINVLDMKQVSVSDFETGKPQAVCGRASYNYLIKGIDLCHEKRIAGIITNPISKEALHLAGIHYPGHTEILAERTGTSDYSMIFSLDNVHVAHVTTHVSLKQAIAMITSERVLANIRLLYHTLLDLGLSSPRIAVGGLNPHAGENGLFGDEELLHIAPAIDKAKNLGIDASGPYPPDTVFMRAFKGEFDGVVSMLHDHGFTALKSRDFERGVNITIGLPIIRTSVGHGTAFNIAGKGIASENSLLEAIRVAVMLWKSRNGF